MDSNFSWSNLKNETVYINKKINYSTIKAEFLAQLKAENGGKDYDVNSSSVLTENKDKFLAFVRTNYGDKYADMFQDGFDPQDVDYQDGEFLNLGEEQDNSVVLSDLLNSAEDADFFDGFFEDDKMQDFLNKFDTDNNGVIDFGEAISAFEAIEKAKADKNNKQDIVLEEETPNVDAGKTADNISDVKDAIVKKDSVEEVAITTENKVIAKSMLNTNVNPLKEAEKAQQNQNQVIAEVEDEEEQQQRAENNANNNAVAGGGGTGGAGGVGGAGVTGLGGANKTTTKNNTNAAGKTTTGAVAQDVTKLSNDALSQYKTAQSTEVTNAENSYNSAKDENSAAKSNLTTVQSETSQNVAEKQSALTDAKAHYDEVASQDSYLQSAEGRELNAKREANLQAISDGEVAQTDAFDAKNKALETRDKEVVTLCEREQAVADCQANVSSAEGTLSGLESALASYQGAVDKDGNPVDTSGLQAQVASARTALENAQKALDNAQRAKDGSQRRLADFENKLAEAEKNYEKATTDLDKAKQEKVDIDALITEKCGEATKQALQEYNNAQQALDTAKSEQITKVNAAQAAVEESEAKMVEMTVARDNAKLEVGKADAEINRRAAEKENSNQKDLFADGMETSFDYKKTSSGIGYSTILSDELKGKSDVPVLFFGVGSGETTQYGMEKIVYEQYLKDMGFNGVIVLCDTNQMGGNKQDLITDYVTEIMTGLEADGYNLDTKNMGYVGFSLGSNQAPNIVLNPAFNGEDAQYHFSSMLSVDGGANWWNSNTAQQLEDNGIKSMGFIGSQRNDMINSGLDYIDLKCNHGQADDKTFTMDMDGDGHPDVIKWLFDKDYEMQNVVKNPKRN